jgi:hypothetical protein
MDLRIVFFDKIVGKIIAEVICVWSCLCYVFPGQLLIFLPQERIFHAWAAHTRERQSFVLCLRSDGVKILG